MTSSEWSSSNACRPPGNPVANIARFHPSAPQVKQDFINVSSLRTWQAVLDKWYTHDGPGRWPDPRAADEVNDDVQSCEAA
jgi:hypothetical protein